jgi:hypothetical protein
LDQSNAQLIRDQVPVSDEVNDETQLNPSFVNDAQRQS